MGRRTLSVHQTCHPEIVECFSSLYQTILFILFFQVKTENPPDLLFWILIGHYFLLFSTNPSLVMHIFVERWTDAKTDSPVTVHEHNKKC